MGATAESVKVSTPTTQPGLRVTCTLDIWRVSLALVLIAVVATALLDTGERFTPRVDIIDALAGLAVGAFAVDRLQTFVPPWRVNADPDKRARDIDTLRWGWGALHGAVLLALTGLIMWAALCWYFVQKPDLSGALGLPAGGEFP